MKILFVATHLNIGGIGTYITSLAIALTKRGHDVTVASSGGALVEHLVKEKINHIAVPIRTKSELNPKVFITALKLSRFVKKEKIEIIHAQTRVTQAAGFYASRLTGIPLVTTCHGFFKPSLHRKIFGFWGDKTVAISEAVRTHLELDMKVKQKNIILIYNGIDVDRFRGRPSPKNGPVIGTVGRLSPVKGYRYLILAFQSVLNDFPSARLLIVGDGPQEKQLKHLSVVLRLDKQISFVGSQEDIRPFLWKMDIFVLPSVAEGLGLSILEAFAAGVPVVASDVGGIKTLVKDFKTGLIVPPRDSAHLSERITKLLRDKGLGERLKEAALDLVYKDFSLDSMALKIESVYKEIVADHAK